MTSRSLVFSKKYLEVPSKNIYVTRRTAANVLPRTNLNVENFIVSNHYEAKMTDAQNGLVESWNTKP